MAGLIELVALRLRRAGVLVSPLPSGGLLGALDHAARAPLKGALPEGDCALCRMALREASLRLTAWPRLNGARPALARAYAWLGGDPAAL